MKDRDRKSGRKKQHATILYTKQRGRKSRLRGLSPVSPTGAKHQGVTTYHWEEGNSKRWRQKGKGERTRMETIAEATKLKGKANMFRGTTRNVTRAEYNKTDVL